ncbi:unnamed protein product, partial [Darwinula stevensoni]
MSSCISIWEQLTVLNVDRNALILSLGGGMITDLGSFAASCFKRGIAHINIPTSLLGMVDASVGGKTGIDFMGFKNHIGVFDTTCETYICSELLSTLPSRELNSVWSEIVKHYLIYDADAFQAFAKLDSKRILSNNEMQLLIERAVSIKTHFVTQDPFDKGVRKALNFGHTIGHAIESHYLSTSAPLLHGEAVAIGLIAESYISFCKGKISENELTIIVSTIHNRISLSLIYSEEFESIYLRSLQDKKNTTTINCVLLHGIGRFELDVPINREEIMLSLNHYNTSCEQYTNSSHYIATIQLPASKSESNRLLILQALSGANLKIVNFSTANDTLLLQKALNSKSLIVNIDDAGTAMRFLTSFYAMRNEHKIVKGTERMHKRPVHDLVEALHQIGFRINYLGQPGFPPIEIIPVNLVSLNNKVTIDGSISSQFISSLIMIGASLPNGLEITITGEVASKPYILLTAALMRKAGIESSINFPVITIAKQEYKTTVLSAGDDWTNASYWYSFVAISHSTELILE